ncbi:sialidase family protein [Terriglobus albidus]|uniref:sialidase family protein n=1 Tax=Terriglobus albidus TaxID=1592106 RepID=UPI0021E0BB00|nr:sialidase family protein [Terriglobus albidus]
MQQRLRFCIALIFAFAAAMAWAQVESVNLWNAGIGGYATYRVPGIVKTRRGTLLAYCGGRKDLSKGDWSPTDILLRRSIDGGHTWEPSRLIAGNGQDLTDNAVMIAEGKTGEVHLLYQKNYAKVFIRNSSDDGKTFSQEREITDVFDQFKPDYDWNVVTPGVGHGIQLRNGRLLASIWIANGKLNPDGTRAHAPAAVGTIYSDDRGRTWKRGALVARDSAEIVSPNETVAAQLPDGRVMVNIRTGGAEHLRAVATSKDGISGWSKPHFDPQLFDPTCDAGLVVDAAEKLVYFSNPDSRDVSGVKDRKWRARENLTLKVSEDDGRTWSHERVLDPGVAGYSDIASGKEELYVIYESGSLQGSQAKPAHISVARVTKSWLMQGPQPKPWSAPE